jgi:hypothetical protein
MTAASMSTHVKIAPHATLMLPVFAGGLLR